MSLAKTLEEHRTRFEPKPCPFVILHNSLSDEDKKALDLAITNKYPDINIATALRAEGYRIAEVSISQHRRGVCRCAKTK